MPNLEVISLSVNKISSLRDFRHCHKLQVENISIILGTLFTKECYFWYKGDKIFDETSSPQGSLVTW